MKALLIKGPDLRGERETVLSTTIVKFQSLALDPEEDTGLRALCKRVRPVSELQQQI